MAAGLAPIVRSTARLASLVCAAALALPAQAADPAAIEADGVLLAPAAGLPRGTLVKVLLGEAPEEGERAVPVKVRLPGGATRELPASAVAVQVGPVRRGPTGRDAVWIAQTRPYPTTEPALTPEAQEAASVVVAQLGGGVAVSPPLHFLIGGSGGDWITCALLDVTGDGRPEVVATSRESVAEVGDVGETLSVFEVKGTILAPLASITAPVFPGVGPFQSGGIAWSPGRAVLTSIEAVACPGWEGDCRAGTVVEGLRHERCDCLRRSVTELRFGPEGNRETSFFLYVAGARWRGAHVAVIRLGRHGSAGEFFDIWDPRGRVREVPSTELEFDDEFMSIDLATVCVPRDGPVLDRVRGLMHLEPRLTCRAPASGQRVAPPLPE